MFYLLSGKARRLKQAKDEATEEIERYRLEREKQFKDFEATVSSHVYIKPLDTYNLFYYHHSTWALAKESPLASRRTPKWN